MSNHGRGHKRTLASTFEELVYLQYNVRKLKSDISDIIIKTLCAASSSLSHVYKSAKPDDISNSMCFQVLGFDIIIDSNLRPWLLEVNHSPSFQTDSQLDWDVKRKVIYDSLTLINIKVDHRA